MTESIAVLQEVSAHPSSGYPAVRMRRLRANAGLRSLVRESHLRTDKLIYPFFVVEGSRVREPIPSMPGIFQQSIDEMLKEAEDVCLNGIQSVLLFGIPNYKDNQASGAYSNKGIVQKAIKALKERFPELIVIADTCLCEYMDHGHCGIIKERRSSEAKRGGSEGNDSCRSGSSRISCEAERVNSGGDEGRKNGSRVSKRGEEPCAANEVDVQSELPKERAERLYEERLQYVLNDPTLRILARTALSQAEAGADVIAPSDMMDGRVCHIRLALDQAGFEHIPIMSYSAKFASALYAPFRLAAESAPKFGDRLSYQMDPANGREALREIELDISEGADIVMIKPALSYLDIVSKARALTQLPIAAYNVSGEYAMVKAAAANGWIDERKVVLEMLTGIVRAGADLIITYHAKDIAQWLK